MPVIETHREYFQVVKQYRLAPQWQKELLIRGSLLTMCNEIHPATVRPRLRRFWEQEAAKLGTDTGKLKTWG